MFGISGVDCITYSLYNLYYAPFLLNALPWALHLTKGGHYLDLKSSKISHTQHISNKHLDEAILLFSLSLLLFSKGSLKETIHEDFPDTFFKKLLVELYTVY